MMLRFGFLLLLSVFFLTGCEPSPQQKADLNAVQTSGVTPAIYDKMFHGDALSVNDIKTLVRARVNEGIIIRYIRDRGTTYFLSSSDIDGLQKAGASSSLIDYMLQTAQYYYNPAPVTVGIGFGYYDSYWGPYYRPYYCRPHGGYYHH